MKAIFFVLSLILAFAPSAVFADPSLIIKDLPKPDKSLDELLADFDKTEVGREYNEARDDIKAAQAQILAKVTGTDDFKMAVKDFNAAKERFQAVVPKATKYWDDLFKPAGKRLRTDYQTFFHSDVWKLVLAIGSERLNSNLQSARVNWKIASAEVSTAMDKAYQDVTLSIRGTLADKFSKGFQASAQGSLFSPKSKGALKAGDTSAIKQADEPKKESAAQK